MEKYKFYSSDNPKVNEIVSCIIMEINEKENIVKLYLKDYNLNAIMSFKNATNRKKKLDLGQLFYQRVKI